MKQENREEIVGRLMDAQEHLIMAIELIEECLDDNYDTDMKNLLNYLKIITSNDHDFLSNDLSLDDLIKEAGGEGVCFDYRRTF